ncbi:MAG: dihydrofolate reductase [Bacteroidales bacterium]
MYNNRVIKLIVATDKNGAIGKDGTLLWHIPSELKHYKSITMGNTLVVGRTTFDTLPNVAKKYRKHLVVSRSDMSFNDTEDIKYFTSIEDALSYDNITNDVYIIGGGSIYKQSLRYVDEVILTTVDAVFSDADTFFDLGYIEDNFEKSDFESIHHSDEDSLKWNVYKYTRK